MWRGRKGSGGREVFKAACGRREAAGWCGFGGWVERGGWGGRGACEAGKRRTWRRPRRSCPVEERGQRGALGPRCSRRPAKAVRLGAGAAATTHGLSTRVAGSRVPGPRKKGPWALICKSSDRRQARGQRPSVRSQGRGKALGNRALTDGLYGPGRHHRSIATNRAHLRAITWMVKGVPPLARAGPPCIAPTKRPCRKILRFLLTMPRPGAF